jgi:thiamine-phosphate pyrophosphorylase
MRLKRKLLNDAKLYLILDRQVNTYDQLIEIARKAVSAGIDVIQLRDKKGSAEEIIDFSKSLSEVADDKALVIVNDRVDLAMASYAAGVHLGQEDIPLAEARQKMGPDGVIGISCQTLEQAKKAQDEGADYIGFGSVFKTLTKPGRSPMDLDVLKKVIREIRIPVFAIGGITVENLKLLDVCNVHRVAVCRAICLAVDVAAVVRQFRTSLQVAIV